MRRILPMVINPHRDDRPAEYAFDPTYPPELVTAFVEAHTRPGEVVFDPFAGFGTTLVEAQRLGRRPFGCEILPDRVALIADRLGDPTAIRCADVRDLSAIDVPGPVTLSLSSPPYMTATDHDEDPLTGYQAGGGDYRRYLSELQGVYAAVAERCHPDAAIVINVANLAIGDRPTTLAWDVGTAVAEVLPFRHEVVIDWDEPPAWLTQDYALVFGTGR